MASLTSNSKLKLLLKLYKKKREFWHIANGMPQTVNFYVKAEQPLADDDTTKDLPEVVTSQLQTC